ncbi:hypothetical protein [[Clostridium] symbiosum]|uniref:hypothetical protein n=1 Tax=Clostridium symbiosum TaxID=1512 RepID=UPI002ED3F4D1
MKRFQIPRPVPAEFAEKLKKIDPVRGENLAKLLERGLIAISLVPRALDLKVVGLTGAKGGQLADVANVAFKVPETETHMVQELHLPIYHCLCLMLEDRFLGKE